MPQSSIARENRSTAPSLLGSMEKKETSLSGNFALASATIRFCSSICTSIGRTYPVSCAKTHDMSTPAASIAATSFSPVVSASTGMRLSTSAPGSGYSAVSLPTAAVTVRAILYRNGPDGDGRGGQADGRIPGPRSAGGQPHAGARRYDWGKACRRDGRSRGRHVVRLRARHGIRSPDRCTDRRAEPYGGRSQREVPRQAGLLLLHRPQERRRCRSVLAGDRGLGHERT